MIETTHRFGAEDHLVGTLTWPATANRQPVAFILLNAGVIHRIGPHRINVKLARRLAASGFVCLRFDLSGVGDSAMARASPATYQERVLGDLRSAMALVGRESGCDAFALAGLCSGADNGFACAASEKRVVGLVMIDGFAYPTRRTNWHRYIRRLGHGPWGALRSWLLRRMRALRARAGGQEGRADSADPGRRPHPPKADYARRLQAIVDRGTAVLLVHSGSLLRRYSYQEQFREAFSGHGFASTVECHFLPDMDHTVTTLAAQAELMQLVERWALRSVVAPPPRLEAEFESTSEAT